MYGFVGDWGRGCLWFFFSNCKWFLHVIQLFWLQLQLSKTIYMYFFYTCIYFFLSASHLNYFIELKFCFKFWYLFLESCSFNYIDIKWIDWLIDYALIMFGWFRDKNLSKLFWACFKWILWVRLQNKFLSLVHYRF